MSHRFVHGVTVGYEQYPRLEACACVCEHMRIVYAHVSDVDMWTCGHVCSICSHVYAFHAILMM